MTVNDSAPLAVMLAKPGLFNVGRILLAVCSGQRVYLLDTNTRRPYERVLFPGMAGVRKLLLRLQSVRDANELDERLVQTRDYRAVLLLADIFGQIENWQSRHFEFSRIDRDLPAFAQCYRATICSEMEHRQFEMFAAECMVRRHPDARLAFSGIDQSTRGAIGALEALKDVHLPRAVSRFAALTNRFRNTSAWIILMAVHFTRILRFVRLTNPASENCFMMADYVSDEDDNKFYEAAREFGAVILVPRTPTTELRQLPEGFAPVFRHRRDGVIPVSQLGAVVLRRLRDCLSVYRHLGGLELQQFAMALSWTFKLAEFEAFFRLGRPKVFFARDCYNPDHILRHQVLTGIGAVHIGINVGYPCYSILFPTTRYISFDWFFVYGTALYEKHYAEKWPAEMELISIGPFRVDEARFTEARQGAGNGDIAVFTGPFIHELAMVRFVRELALGLPERQILLQVKNFFRNLEPGRDYVRDCTDGLPNVIPVNDDVYDILKQVTYSVTDPSSIVVEAMSLGRVSFLADLSSWQRSCYFHDFDDILVRSGGEAARKIRALEAGTEAYPWHKFENVAYLSNDYFMNRVRDRLQQIDAADRQAS
jgi:hypothetical protein